MKLNTRIKAADGRIGTIIWKPEDLVQECAVRAAVAEAAGEQSDRDFFRCCAAAIRVYASAERVALLEYYEASEAVDDAKTDYDLSNSTQDWCVYSDALKRRDDARRAITRRD